MRVAVVGTGAFTKHYLDELPAAGREVVLVKLLRDCDPLVCGTSDLTQTFVDVNVALIDAYKQTPKCKRFIPSGYGGNVEDFRKKTESLFHHDVIVRDVLMAQDELEWTVVCIGWVMDFIVPTANRHHADGGPIFPLDLHAKTMTIPGTGNERFTMTSPKKWRPYTYVQGAETTRLELAEVIKKVGGVPDLKVSFESLDDIRATLSKKESVLSMLTAELKLIAPSGELKFDQAKVQRDRADFFPNVHFTSKRLRSW
ncbi:hypothetical protein PHMEG_00037078 [Phytophthora megakarya]|uniref:Uncharacterized protein n=1 Tax=Phytophthora megakarya TaxID=4795 RepID=A0A225UJW6_9STRA|nr:hypothetical protein PHMEG_00037078 [Phytophthora megakarya]